MCQVGVEANEAFTSLLVCDRCEKVRSVKGDVPDGRWTCCHQPAEDLASGAAVLAKFPNTLQARTHTSRPILMIPRRQIPATPSETQRTGSHSMRSKGKEVEGAVDKKGKGIDVEEGAAAVAPSSTEEGPRLLTFSCISCLRARSLPDGMSEGVSRCCDVPDAQVVSLCGGARIASQLLKAGVATQEGLAALDVDGEDGSELSRVASAARVNPDALLEWVTQARGRELDEVMHDLLAPPHPEVKSWDVKVVFARLEERAGVSTPADLAAADLELTLLPALHGLTLTARDLVLMRAKAEARLAEAPPWMWLVKSSFGSGYGDGVVNVDGGAAVGDDTVDVELLRVGLQAMREHPDIAQAGESVRYLYRISCNIVDEPEEARYRRLRLDNRAYVAHVCGVKGASLAMEALGWRESLNGSACVLHEGARISSATTDVILECMKGLIARAALKTVAAAAPRENHLDAQ